MALKIQKDISAKTLRPKIEQMFDFSAAKIRNIEKTWDAGEGTPVFTVEGKYTTRGWTEWTQGFQFGSALLQFDATGEREFLDLGRRKTFEHMATHVSHFGVHDHGFNNVSTYGNLWRLMREGKIDSNEDEKRYYELALKISGAVQAARWTKISNGDGYIYSFNGPHSLFVDTMRSLRSLAVAHQLGHALMGERDQKLSLLERLLAHGKTTAAYNIYYGEGRDSYDVNGRTAHESIFNVNDGNYRCPNSQQGYSPFSTWTRGLAWAICGFAEQLEFLEILDDETFKMSGGKSEVMEIFRNAAAATADFYIENCCTDGVPVWDTGAPDLYKMGGFTAKPSDPFNQWEPIDSSAAAIAAQGLVRLGKYLKGSGRYDYQQAGLSITATLLDDPYISRDDAHQGLLLHSVYHRPNGWDHIHQEQKVPNGESSMWGDYHLRELALMLLKEVRGEPHLTFFDPSIS
jgi:unsaturated chondroitin disaccharide hydrolase